MVGQHLLWYVYSSPAEYGLFEGGFIDNWGYSDLDSARSWLNSEEKGLDGDNLVDWKRKFPAR